MKALATIAAAFAIAGAIFFAGDRYGAGRVQAATNAKSLQEAADTAEAARKQALAEQALHATHTVLEDAAHAAPVSAPECLPAPRVLRLSAARK